MASSDEPTPQLTPFETEALALLREIRELVRDLPQKSVRDKFLELISAAIGQGPEAASPVVSEQPLDAVQAHQ